MNRCLLAATCMFVLSTVKANNGASILATTPPRVLGTNAEISSAESQPPCDVLTSYVRNSPLCNGGSDGSLSVTVFGTNPPFSYTWETGLSNQPLTSIPAGDYDITITDGTGCTQVETVTLADNPDLNVSLTSSPILCYHVPGGALHPFVTGGVGTFAFNWSNGSTASDQLNLGPGTYTVTVSDGNGCTATASQTLTEPDSLRVEIVSMSGFCTGSTTGTITVQAFGGTPPYKYVWITNGNQMGPTISNVGPGYFYVCVIDANGCQKDLPITIPPTGALNVSLAVTSAECPGVNDGTATAIVTGGSGNYSYSWSYPPNNPPVPQINGIPAGTTITVTVTDNIAGCTGTATAQVGAHNQVQVQVTDTDADCNNSPTGTAVATATNGTAPYTYQWSQGPTQIPGNPITNLTAGAYQVFVTDARGCTGVGVADIAATSNLNANFSFEIVQCLPNGQVLLAILDNSTVPNSSVNAWNWNIAWSSGTAQPTTQNPTLTLPENETGTIQLSATSAAGCTGFVSKPFDLSVLKMSLSVADTDVPCNNAAIGTATATVQNGIGNINYVWNPGNLNGNPLTGLSANTYTVTATDTRGCSATGTANIEAQNTANANFNFSIVQCLGNQVAVEFVDNSGNAVSWNWDINGGNFNVQNPPAILFPTNVNGTANLTITDANGCTASVTKPINLPNNYFDLAVSGTGADCTGATSGTAIANPSNGLAPYQYLWSPNGETTQQISGGPGAYSVSVTDARGCVEVDSTEIGSSSDLQAAYELIVIECLLNDSVLVQFQDNTPSSNIVSWNWQINWTGNNYTTNTAVTDTLTLADLQAGNVLLTVTDAAGCTGTVNAPFNVDAVPDANITVNLPALSCAGAPVTLTAVGDTNLVYTWSPALGLNTTSGPNVIANPAQSTVYTLTVENGLCKKEILAPVEVAPPIGLNAPDAVTTCETTDTLTATTNVPAIIVWSGNGLNDTASTVVVPAGIPTKIYTVTAIDTFGCKVVDQLSVTGLGVDVQLNVAGGSACENTDLSINTIKTDPTDTVTYVWSSVPPLNFTPPNGPNPTVNAGAGVYVITLVATNQHGCTKVMVDTIEFTDGQISGGTISADLCKGLSVAFSASGGSTGIWHFGDGTTGTGSPITHVYPDSGLYHVTYSSGAACVADIDTTIFVWPDVAVQADFGFDIQRCEDFAEFKFNDSTFHYNPIVSWNWQFSPGTPSTSTAQNPTIVFNTPGPATAILTVTDNLGCKDTDTTEVLYHIVSDTIVDLHRYCGEDTVALNPTFDTDYTYTWTSVPPDPELAAQSNNPNPFVSPADSTVYTVVIQLGGCVVTKTATVVPKDSAQVLASDDKVVCVDDPIKVSVVSGNGTQYIWADNLNFNPILGTGSEIFVQPEREGVIYVRAITGEDCEAIDSVRINNAKLNMIPPPPNATICLGDSTQLVILNNNPEDQLIYQWSDPSLTGSSPFVSPNASTDYVVTIGNQFGCFDTLTTRVDVEVLAATATASPETICPTQSTTLEVTPGGSGYSFEWEPASTLDDPTSSTPTATPTETTTYTVTVTDEGPLGCVATASVTVNLTSLQCEEPFIFIPKAFTPNGDNKNNTFRVRGLNIKEIYFVVYDRWGEEVYKTTDPSHTGWDGSYKGRELTPDAYGWYVRVLCVDGEEFVRKGNVTLLK